MDYIWGGTGDNDVHKNSQVSDVSNWIKDFQFIVMRNNGGILCVCIELEVEGWRSINVKSLNVNYMINDQIRCLVSRWFSFVWICHSVYLPIDRHLSCFQFLVISNKATWRFLYTSSYGHVLFFTLNKS